MELPGDKSISHRAAMIASIAEGVTRIENFAHSQDCVRTVEAFRQMGVEIDLKGDRLVVKGAGLNGLKKPASALYLGNSGTTMRLILGILAGQPFECTLTGDESLSLRPMGRVTGPLRQMGARIDGRKDAEFAPLKIKGGRLKPISYKTPVPSAQVKSAILLAGLYADGVTRVEEKLRSRDHTSRMLQLFGAVVKTEPLAVSVKGKASLSAKDIKIPGDISSASFFIIGAALLKGSSISIKGLLHNPTRSGILDILRHMGADVEILNDDDAGFERVCSLKVNGGPLRGVEIGPEVIPSAIDELPIIMVAASLAKGVTVIRGAKELRVKETDRIHSITTNLTRMGAYIRTEGDDVIIKGVERLKGAELESFGDHRTAMSMAIAALTARGPSTVSGIECVNTSFPAFFEKLKRLTRN